MKGYSTNQAARKLGLSIMTMHRYIKAGKIQAPPMRTVAGVRVRIWMEKDIERVRKLLPKIANGRKTRWQKQLSAVSTQQSVKNKRAQAGAPAVQKKSRKPKKK